MGDAYADDFFKEFEEQAGKGLNRRDNTVTWSCWGHENFGYINGGKKEFGNEQFILIKKLSGLSIKGKSIDLHMHINYSEENYLEASSMKGMFRLQVGGSPVMGTTDTTIQFVLLYVNVDPWSAKLKGITTFTVVGTCRKLDIP